MQLQLLGWGPDLDPTTPGVLVDMQKVIPTSKGFRVIEFNDVLAQLDSTYVIRTMAVGAGTSISAVHAVVAAYHSTTTNSTCTLLELSGGSGTVRGTYTAGPYTSPVMFRQFDNEMYAVRHGSPMKRAARASDFTAVSGAPECTLLESTRDFLIAFNTTAGYDWHCCAIGNALDWNLSVSNQCVRGEFFDKAGPVVCASRNGEYVIAFTRSQTYLGRYVGAPEVWQWEQISRDVGCVGPEAACETPYGTCWIGRNDIYVYNGQGIAPLDTKAVRKTIFGGLDTSKLQFAQVAWDRKNGLLWVFMAPNAGTAPYSGRVLIYVYHFESKRWAPDPLNQIVMAANQLSTPEYAGVGAASASVTFDDFLYATSGFVYRLLGDDRQNLNAYITTGSFGSPTLMSMVRAVRPVYAEKGNSRDVAILETSRYSVDGSATASQTATLDTDFKFQFRQTGRWHSVKIGMSYEDTINVIDVDMVPMGSR